KVLTIKEQASSSFSGLEGERFCFACKGRQELCRSDGATTEVPGNAASRNCARGICAAQEVCRGRSLGHREQGRLYPRVGHRLEAPGGSSLRSQRLGALHDCVRLEFYWWGVVFT